MTSEELAQEVETFIRAASGRITGVGNDQYERDGEQRFESLPLSSLFSEAEEELLDVAAYATMLNLRLRGIEKKLVAHFDRLRQDLQDVKGENARLRGVLQDVRASVDMGTPAGGQIARAISRVLC